MEKCKGALLLESVCSLTYLSLALMGVTQTNPCTTTAGMGEQNALISGFFTGVFPYTSGGTSNLTHEVCTQNPVLAPLEVPSAFKTEDYLTTCWKYSWRTVVTHKDSPLFYLLNWRWQNSKVQTKQKIFGHCIKSLYSIQITARYLDWSQRPHLLRSVS